MKVILLIDIAKLGRKYEEKEVADGYARNVLIPQKKAVQASTLTPTKLAEMKAYQEKIATKKQDDIAKALLDIPERTVTIAAKASSAGHLFAGVTTEVLSKELKKQFKVNILPEAFDLPKAIKEIGEREVGFAVDSKLPKLKVVVEGSK